MCCVCACLLHRSVSCALLIITRSSRSRLTEHMKKKREKTNIIERRDGIPQCYMHIVRTCKCRQDGDEREKPWKSIRLPIQLHIPRLPIPIQKREEDGNHPIVSYLCFLFSLPFWQMSASNFLERYRNKRAVPSTSKKEDSSSSFFLFFSAFTGSLFPFSGHTGALAPGTNPAVLSSSFFLPSFLWRIW